MYSNSLKKDMYLVTNFSYCCTLSGSNTNYENCLKIEVNNKLYNIDLENNLMFNEEEELSLIQYNWFVITVPISNSDSKFRRIFERCFDELYNKPAFSRKK